MHNFCIYDVNALHLSLTALFAAYPRQVIHCVIHCVIHYVIHCLIKFWGYKRVRIES